MTSDDASYTREQLAEFTRLIEQEDARRHAEYEARRDALTPHVRKPQPRHGGNRRAGTSPHNRAPVVVETLCGAEPTIVDWDRRTAASRTHAAAADAQVCPECLRIARS